MIEGFRGMGLIGQLPRREIEPCLRASRLPVRRTQPGTGRRKIKGQRHPIAGIEVLSQVLRRTFSGSDGSEPKEFPD